MRSEKMRIVERGEGAVKSNKGQFSSVLFCSVLFS